MQWIAAALAILMPTIIVIGFVVDARTNIAPGEQLIYADSWSANRSDAEIKAAQQERLKQKEAADKQRQHDFQKLERRLGL